MLEVEIWSDVMCPFCYIGKRKFEKAIEQFENRNLVKIHWKSFLLDPDLVSDKSKSIHQHLSEAKGWSLSYAQEMNAYVSEMATKEGLNYNMNAIKVANTFNAHRLIQMAKTRQLATEAEEALFKAYFCEGKDLADTEVLVQLSEKIGLDPSETLKVLEGREYTNEVLRDLKEADSIGVSGVPYFLFNRKFAVSGAQDSRVFLDAMRKAMQVSK
ncbi:MAG TPA: DsbA family oxidoreductase [Bacteroidia bacterium]|nr:DsbA family oxidoreductase [Bacteroidia bacterium]